MTWEDRPYSSYPEHGGRPSGGGMQSWLGGLPRAGKVVKWIMLANAVMFVLCQLTGGWESPLFEGLAMQSNLVLEGQIWRLFTFTYLHDQSGLWHVFLNMLGLYFLGTPLERLWGAKRFFAFYTLGGFVAVFLYLVITVVGWLSPHVPLIGASGGVLAVLGACAVLFPQFRIIFIFFPVPIRTAALILVVLYSFNLMSRGANAGGDACHLAGLVFGIAWGYRGHIWTQKWREKKAAIKRGAWEAKRHEQQAIEEEVDRILEKVHRDGVNSLTRRERHRLELATKMQRESDRHHGH